MLMLNIEGKDEKLVVGREAINKSEDIKNLAPSDLEDYVLLTQEFGVWQSFKNTVMELIMKKIDFDMWFFSAGLYRFWE